jgi:hypothetical protein
MDERRDVHRTIVILDVERFGDPRRTNPHQLAVREGLYRSVGDAFRQAKLPWASDTYEDRGDGILILLPAEVPKSLVVELLPPALVAALTAHNRTHPAEAGIRLRMALHAGEVPYDGHGVAGRAVNWAFRLIEAKLLKAALAASSGALAIITSSWFYDEVVQHAADGIPATYRRVLVRAKEGAQPGWICLPDDTRRPAAATSPYKGLRAFEKADEDLFFGRENAVQDLMKAVAVSALVPVVGKSGVGKSSLVQAGLLPRLEKAGWAVETIVPRPDLPTALTAALARLSGAPPIVPGPNLGDWRDYLARHGLSAAAERARQDRKWERAVLFIDQFEEALAWEEESVPIFQELAELPDGGRLTVVLTLREDSFGALFVGQGAFGDRLRRNAVPLSGMEKNELTEAIRLPADWYGCDVTNPLLEELIEAIRGNPGALPLLEFSLDQMWRALPPEKKERLSSDDYRQIHGLNGALAAHADQVLNSLSPPERAMVRNLFVNHFTSVDQPGVRRVLRRSDCDAEFWPVIVRLADERLLTVGCDEHGHQTAEVVHEELLRSWNRLHGWLDAEGPFRRWRQRLREDIRSWSETADSRELLTGSPLAQAKRWLDDRKSDLNDGEIAFINASIDRQQEQESHDRAIYRRAQARELTHRAESVADPELALLYAIKVIKDSPDPPAARLVRSCLHRLGAAELQPVSSDAADAAVRRFGRRLTLAEWSRGPGPGGRWLLGELPGGLIISEDGEARYRAGAAMVMPGPVVAAACTQAGVACLVTEAGELALWQLVSSDQAVKTGERNFRASVACVALDDVAEMVVVACGGDQIAYRIRALDRRSLAEAAVPSGGFVRDIDISADCRVAVLGHDRRLQVWDLRTRELLCESVTGLDVSRIAFDQETDEDYVVAVNTGTGAVGGFPVRTGLLEEQARQAVNRELTAEELVGLEDPFA